MFYPDGSCARRRAGGSKLAEPELRLHPEPRADGDGLERARRQWRYDDDDVVDLAPYILAIRERWRSIAAAAIAAGVAAALIATFILPKWYRARAIVRPIATPAVESRIAGVLGGLGGGAAGLGGLGAALGAGGSNDADEYLAIMQGFQFSAALAARHHIEGELLKPGFVGQFLPASKPADPDWAVYRVLSKRFEAEYSVKTGNVTLYFQAHERRNADEILGYYIDDLRELLRAREVSGASSAIDSLEVEAGNTADPVLRTELYELIAKQVLRKKMALVEADFAFRVLDPPAASDKAYRPKVVLDAVLAGMVVLFAGCVIALIKGAPLTRGTGLPRRYPGP